MERVRLRMTRRIRVAALALEGGVDETTRSPTAKDRRRGGAGRPSPPSLGLGGRRRRARRGHDGALLGEERRDDRDGARAMDCWYYSPFPIEFGGDGHSAPLE